MSGIKRNILNELQQTGTPSMEEYQAAFTPEAMLKEEGTPDAAETSEK